MINYLLVNLISKLFEPMTGVEPVTPSLPRKCSTTELHRHIECGRGCDRSVGVNVKLHTFELLPIAQRIFERETRLELATLTLEGLCSTN